MSNQAIQPQKAATKEAELVRTLIHEWDPYSLLAGGAPDDEWDHEIETLLGYIDQMWCQNDAVTIISKIFSEAFVPEDFSPDACQEIGERLYYRLKEENLL